MKVLSFEHQGQRPSQQDSSYISHDMSLFLVCDGVGGSMHGGEASRIIKDSIESQYKNRKISHVEKDLKEFLVQANYNLLNTFSHTTAKAASSTLVLVLLKDGKAYTTHLGDSKIFYINKVTHEYWVSKDHSLVQELFEAGILESENEMKSHPLKNRITLAMSSDSLVDELEIKVDVIPNINKGDIFILCTDGVLENLTSDQMVELFTNNPIEEAYKHVKSLCEEHSRDNNTAIFVEI
jgi:serine/threonine protein phosphatase PrpC